MIDDELERWFRSQQEAHESAYLASSDPHRQSGWGSTPERWRIGREVILDAVPFDGDFLDIGCANGLLLECLVRWARERGILLTPHGLDVSARLVALARRRLRTHDANLHTGNAFTWTPPRRYTYVHTLLEYVPADLHGEYLHRLLDHAVEPLGRLIVSNYGSRSRAEPPVDVAALLRGMGLEVAGSAASAEEDGWVATRVAWVQR